MCKGSRFDGGEINYEDTNVLAAGDADEMSTSELRRRMTVKGETMWESARESRQSEVATTTAVPAAAETSASLTESGVAAAVTASEAESLGQRRKLVIGKRDLDWSTFHYRGGVSPFTAELIQRTLPQQRETNTMCINEPDSAVIKMVILSHLI